LAYNHEGTEAAEWLNSLGVTAVVVKYRVPTRSPNGQRWTAAVQDTQRAMRIVRSRASEWGIDPTRIGLLGFSAGGETAGLAAILADTEHYPARDAVDRQSAKPAFAALIYPGGLYDPKAKSLKPEVRVTTQTPPMFLIHAFDDNVDCHNSLLLASELKKAGVRCELHLYASGGHGYGMRETGHPVNSWPARMADWMQKNNWLANAKVPDGNPAPRTTP
jgi:acetyl esterase/lipase